jgi:hypothetical protein
MQVYFLLSLPQYFNFDNFLKYSATLYNGRAIAQAVSHWLPTAEARVHIRAEHVGFVVDKVALRQIFSEYLVSPANHHSTNFSIIIITWGWHNRPIGGCSAEWTQLDSTPHYSN